MLKELKVSNLAVVERADVSFVPGLTVITGETGAGKSVLMGALDLVLGGRAEASEVRDGATEAEIEAVFAGEAGSGEKGKEIVIRRTLTAAGRSRAWVNDESVSLAELRELGVRLVDIHGPRANQRLLEEDFQREALDAEGAIAASAAFASYRAAYATWRRLADEEAALRTAGDDDALDLLRYQVNEIEAAALTDDDETVAERHAAAAHAEEIVSDANAVTETLGGDDRSVAERLIALQPKWAALARHLPAAADWSREAEDITVRVQELSRTVADAVSRLEASEESLDELDARLTVLNKLKRKYGATVAEIREKLAEKKAKRDALENRDARLAELAKARAKAEGELRRQGDAVTALRRKAGVRMAKTVTQNLKDLGFLQAKFFIALEACEPTADGLDRVVFMFEPNPGETARPLASIASSGEIARVMLALKSILAAHDRVGTLVFDEIDANIGGEVGRVVGEKMRTLSARRQVIAITHLPQSAVFGERHLVVSKHVSGGRTRTRVEPVEGASRVAEIARMLGGENLTSVVKRHAQELLQLSR